MPLVATRGAASAQGFGEFAQQTAANYIEDVFSTWLYTGNGSTQTITNGIDLSTKGGLLWMKSRSQAAGHMLYDTASNATLRSDTTGANSSYYPTYISPTSSGFFLDAAAGGGFNTNAVTYASWTFRKQPKFFDVVTFSTNGSGNATVSHSLGSTPGCVIIKATTAFGGTFDGSWWVYHRRANGGTNPGNYYLILNSTGGEQNLGATWITPSSTNFTITGSAGLLQANTAYVAYVFAHDAGGFGLTGTDNVISCGSYTGNGSTTGPTITLGYEPQWIMIKNASNTANWVMQDVMRGMPVGGNTLTLFANLSNAESDPGNSRVQPTATGFQIANTASSALNTAGETYIYIAIRRGPMKTPTTGTSVFDPETYTGNATARSISGLGFPPDLVFPKIRDNGGGFNGTLTDRLRGVTNYIVANDTAAEATNAQYVTVLGQDGFSLGTGADVNRNTSTFVSWNFRRAPGFFDVVCYTGTGSSATSYSHNLGVAPELIINKVRSASGSNWIATFNFTSTNYVLAALNLTNAGGTFLYTDGASIEARPTSTAMRFTGGVPAVNDSGQTYVAYLFASCPGVSKVGSYTGTGALQTINCGFTGGARFVMIKRTDSTGDWWLYDSARGISSGNDPYLFINSTAAEVTGTNYVDTTSVGFQVTAAAPAGLNANGGTYIFLAIA